MSLKEFQDSGLGCHFGYGLQQYFRNFESQNCPNAFYVDSAKIKFRFKRSGVRVVVLFNNFKMAVYGDHLGYRNKRNLAILNLLVALMPHIRFQLNQTFGYVADKNFKMATMEASHHLGYQDETILAFVNLHIAPILFMKFRFNPTFCLGGDVNFEEFQDDRHGGHLEYQDVTILSILTLNAALL